jgi:hypothetical protein
MIPSLGSIQIRPFSQRSGIIGVVKAGLVPFPGRQQC